MAFPSDEVKRQEKQDFLSGNLTKRKAEYESKSCFGNCSKKKICCFSCLGCILAVLLVLGGGALYFLTLPTLAGDADKWDEMLSGESSLGNSSVDGTYTLVSYDDNYETYLKSMGIPWLVVPLILRGSESLEIKLSKTGAEIKTITDWVTREMEFEFDTVFNMTYGRGMGIMYNICERPQHNVVFCKSEEREKNWKLSSHMTFSERGMVNERIFLNKNIGAKKYYQKEGFGLDESFPVVTEKEVDIFAEDDESWEEDEDW
eukprot:GFUD01115628.1.p1 GENE.GFUD01115628.1~~GFUD01115628.1.p1  ORF type:complete len:260 (+),score=77.60 GFUD01115628.1:59-838(+)